MKIYNNFNDLNSVKRLCIRLWPNIRTIKQTITLNDYGIKTILLCSGDFLKTKLFNRYKGIFFNVITFNKNPKQITRSVINDENFDFIECESQPSWYSKIAVQDSLKPVICNLHDVCFSFNDTTDEDDIKDEIYSLNNADGIIVTSEYFKELIIKVFKNMSIREDSITVLGNWLSLNILPINKFKDKINNSIVYSGEIVDSCTNVFTGYSFRYLLNIFKDLLNLGFSIYCYPSRENINMLYFENYIKLMKKNPNKFFLMNNTCYDLLLDEMTRYSFGLSAFNFSNLNPGQNEFLNFSFPGKIGDYLASEIPTLSYSGTLSNYLVSYYNIGIILDNFNNLTKKIQEYGGINDIKEKQFKFSIDKHIYDTLNLYRKVLYFGRRVLL